MAAVKRNKISKTARERAVSNDSDNDGAPSGPAAETVNSTRDDSFDGPAPPTHGRNANRTKTMSFGTGSQPKKPAGLRNLQIDDSNDVDEHGEPQDAKTGFKSSKTMTINSTTTATPRGVNLPSARAARNPLSQSSHQGTPAVKTGSSKISSVNKLS